jgi:hypothetical protein
MMTRKAPGARPGPLYFRPIDYHFGRMIVHSSRRSTEVSRRGSRGTRGLWLVPLVPLLPLCETILFV